MRKPIIRIKDITIKNLKNVNYGKLSLMLQSTSKDKTYESDILALYGPNGSGKSALIDAFTILKALLSNNAIPERYAAYISAGQQSTTLTYNLLIQHDSVEQMQEVVYSVTFTKTYDSQQQIIPTITEEALLMAGHFNNATTKLQPIICADLKNNAFTPSSKHKYFINNSKNLLNKIDKQKANCFSSGKSFIFSKETLNIFSEKLNANDYITAIYNLQNFGENKLCVINDMSAAVMASHAYLPLKTPSLNIALSTNKDNKIDSELYSVLDAELNKINNLLPFLIPNLQIKLTENQNNNYRLYAQHDSYTLPLCLESSGTLKLIATINQLIAVYNDPYATIIIDELDENLFEYMLGRLLSLIQCHGKGQLIFTAHQLTPLGLLDRSTPAAKKSKVVSIAFTTTNPNNKYIRMKNMCNSNNPREVYLKLITNSLTSKVRKEQDEQLCNIYDDADIIKAITI